MGAVGNDSSGVVSNYPFRSNSQRRSLLLTSLAIPLPKVLINPSLEAPHTWSPDLNIRQGLDCAASTAAEIEPCPLSLVLPRTTFKSNCLLSMKKRLQQVKKGKLGLATRSSMQVRISETCKSWLLLRANMRLLRANMRMSIMVSRCMLRITISHL